MKSIVLCTSLLLLLGACTRADEAREANEVNFTKAMNAYLAKRGNLCLAKTTWPIDVTREEAESGTTRDAVQMPVLEKLGLVSSTEVTVERKGEESTTTSPGRRYVLTDAGKQYYLPRTPRKYPVAGSDTADHDFCAARLTLDKVAGWDKPIQSPEGTTITVSYTYKIDAASWTADPQVRRVFPMVDALVTGAGVRQLQEAMVLTDHGWEAKDL